MGRRDKETSQRLPLGTAKKNTTLETYSHFFKTLSVPVFMIFARLWNQNVTFHIFERTLLISTNLFEKAGD